MPWTCRESDIRIIYPLILPPLQVEGHNKTVASPYRPLCNEHHTLSTAKLLRSVALAIRRLLMGHNSTSTIRCVGWNRSIGNPNVDQRLHWLRIPVREQSVEFGDRAKVDKARVEVSPTLSVILSTQVPEGVDPMRMIEMRIDAEYLTKTCAAVMEECLRKACTLANPVTTFSIRTARRVWTGRSSGNLGRERFGVVNLASHPPLDQRDVLRCRYGNWVFLMV